MAGSGARAQQRSAASELGASMRWARRPSVRAGTAAQEIYGRAEIMERHRHRYEFNNNYSGAISAGRLCSPAYRSMSW